MNAQPTPKTSHISITPFEGTVTVRVSDAVLASTQNALLLKEGDYQPVFYIPFEDISFDLLRNSETTSHCRHKGDASYWSTSVGAGLADDVMWAYQEPFDQVSAIADHGAFYPGKVQIEATESNADSSQEP